ncbi:MAG: WYL domain-containing protein, partial [Candidatus Rokubacteria bacterium]|nr:WYL domain-containing protein [Candidatus Rokubacteria bacterium]
MSPERPPGFYQWWRTLPKRAVIAAEPTLPFSSTILEGISRRCAVSLRYRTDSRTTESLLLIYPRQLYRRGRHAYVEGTTYPSGKFQTLRLDRVTDAHLAPGAAHMRIPASNTPGGHAYTPGWKVPTRRRSTAKG